MASTLISAGRTAVASRTAVGADSRLTLFNMTANSLYFDAGYSNSAVTVTHNSVMNIGTGDFSVIGWGCLNKPSSNDGAILYKYNTANSQGFACLFNSTGKLSFVIYNGGGSITTDLVYKGRWINFAFIRRSGVSYIYANGILVKTGTSAPGNMDGTQNMYMGRDIGGNKKLTGYLKDIHYYGRALTDTEIKSYFAGVQLATTNLIGWWKMDEGTGNAADSSGNSLTGTITDAKWTNNIPVALRSSL